MIEVQHSDAFCMAYIGCYRLANAGWVKSVARGVCDRPRAAFVLALWLAYNEFISETKRF